MNKSAKWICSPENWDEACFEFYKNIKLKKAIKKAELRVSSMGLYCAFINGKRITNELFTPGFTSYDKRIQYQNYNVSELLSEEIQISILASEGWAVGNLMVLPGKHHRYSDRIAVIFSLEVEYESGEKEFFNSDRSVRVRTSHITSSSIYNGETVDMTSEIRELGNAELIQIETKLIPNEGERVCEKERITPKKLIKTPMGETVIDFGQNLVGYVEIKAEGKRGDKIELSHGEILDKDGNFYNENLRSAKEKTIYILSGDGKETFKPTYSWQGFRYIRIDEYPDPEIDISNFCGVVVYSDIKRSSYFSCGNEKINQLYSNVLWGQKGNFIDIPTDCPQRDERIGWTGDAQVFVKTAAINYDVERFFKKWLRDLALEQDEDGMVGQYVPYCNLEHPRKAVAAWGDAAVICPWELYLAYGSAELLEEQYPSMKKWVDYIRGVGEEEYLWIGGGHLGDWLALDDEESMKSRQPTKGNTNQDYIASAFFAYSTSLLIKAGEALGKNMQEYRELLQNIKNAISSRFFRDGMPSDNTQTAYVLALRFGLCGAPKRAAEKLNELVRKNGNRLTTGFVATPHLLHALSENGYTETAYDLLLQEKFPSWLYSVNMGATTIWEHWDGIREDGTLWDKIMNSYNHYAYGAVIDWIFGVAAGIKCLDDGAGYKHVSIAPIPDERLGYLNYLIDTRSGRIVSSWKYLSDNSVRFEIEIPDGTLADIALPDGRKFRVNGGIYTFYVES